jgi:hypothetical protein
MPAVHPLPEQVVEALEQLVVPQTNAMPGVQLAPSPLLSVQPNPSTVPPPQVPPLEHWPLAVHVQAWPAAVHPPEQAPFEHP